MSTPKPSAPRECYHDFHVPGSPLLSERVHMVEYSAYESIKNKLHQHENGMRNCMSCGSSGDDVKVDDSGYHCKCGYSWMSIQQVWDADAADLRNERDALKTQLAEVTRERDEAVEAERELRKIAVGIEGAKTEGYRAALEAIIARKALTEAEGE